MRLIETPWGKMFPLEVVKRFLDLSAEAVKKNGLVLRDLLFQLWLISPEDGEIVAYIAFKRRWPSPLRELAGDILLRGPVVERMMAEIESATALKRILSVARNGDDLVFNLRQGENGLSSLDLLWRRIGDTFSVPARVDELIQDVMRFKYLPGLRVPFVFSAMRGLAERAEWLAPKIFRGLKEVTLIRRARPLPEEEETRH